MNDVQLTRNFGLRELCYSPTALTRDVPNVPGPAEVEAMTDLCVHVLQPLRDLLGKPVRVNSGYRCALLNSLVGGANGSQHRKGQAADIEVDGMTSLELFRVIVENLPFDQVIEEFGSWVHVSYKKIGNRGSMLQARKAGGRTVYENIV